MSGLGEMGHLLKQAQEMQRQLDRVREELSTTEAEGQAGGGMVRVKVSADRRSVLGVTLAPEVLAEKDATMVEDLVRAALQDALRRAAETEKKAMERVTGGLNLPGLL